MTADCYIVITAVVGASSKVVISTYHHGYVPDSFLEEKPEIKCLLGKHESSVCSGETSIPKSAKRETVSHAPVGLSYYAVNASSGDAVKSIYLTS